MPEDGRDKIVLKLDDKLINQLLVSVLQGWLLVCDFIFVNLYTFDVWT